MSTTSVMNQVGAGPKAATVHKMAGKYGKVYVEKKKAAATTEAEPSSSSSTSTTLSQLEDVLFSNVDLKWYTPSGEPSPEYEKHLGKPFFYEFTMMAKDVSGRPVEFSGRLRPLYNLGGLPTITVEELEWADKTTMDWSINTCKLYAADDEFRLAKFRKICTGTLATVLTLGTPREWRTMLMLFIPPIYFVDEILLEVETKPYRRTHDIATACSDVMRGTREWDDNHDRNCPEPIRPYFYATKLMREYALTCVTEEEAQPMFMEYSKHLYSFAIENCLEWKALEREEPVIFGNGQPNVRLLNSGAKIVMEMVLVNYKIVINNKIRESFLFRQFYTLFEKQATITNDLFSYQRELDNGETCNHVYVLHAVKGLTLEEALQVTLDEVNSLAEQMITLGKILTEQFSEDPMVGRFVEVAKKICEGHYQFYSYGLRENLKFSFHCIVEDDE